MFWGVAVVLTVVMSAFAGWNPYMGNAESIYGQRRVHIWATPSPYMGKRRGSQALRPASILSNVQTDAAYSAEGRAHLCRKIVPPVKHD